MNSIARRIIFFPAVINLSQPARSVLTTPNEIRFLSKRQGFLILFSTYILGRLAKEQMFISFLYVFSITSSLFAFMKYVHSFGDFDSNIQFSPTRAREATYVSDKCIVLNSWLAETSCGDNVQPFLLVAYGVQLTHFMTVKDEVNNSEINFRQFHSQTYPELR
jgi:hypothetical protein